MVGGIMAMVLIVGLVMLEQVHLPRENQTIAAVVSTLVITSYAFSSIVLVITEVFLIMLGTIHFTSMYGIRWARFHWLFACWIAVLLHASFRNGEMGSEAGHADGKTTVSPRNWYWEVLIELQLLKIMKLFWLVGQLKICGRTALSLLFFSRICLRFPRSLWAFKNEAKNSRRMS